MMAGEQTSSNSPIPIEKLSVIATEACDTALEGVTTYDHEKVNDWNSKIISATLQSLISATAPPSSQTDSSDSSPPKTQYRFNVSCTLIQQGLGNTESTTNGSGSGSGSPSSPAESSGRRGMHTASGAYWDVKRDGMWTFKYPRAEEKGLDLVLNIVWFGSG